MSSPRGASASSLGLQVPCCHFLPWETADKINERSIFPGHSEILLGPTIQDRPAFSKQGLRCPKTVWSTNNVKVKGAMRKRRKRQKFRKKAPPCTLLPSEEVGRAEKENRKGWEVGFLTESTGETCQSFWTQDLLFSIPPPLKGEQPANAEHTRDARRV